MQGLPDEDQGLLTREPLASKLLPPETTLKTPVGAPP